MLCGQTDAQTLKEKNQTGESTLDKLSPDPNFPNNIALPSCVLRKDMTSHEDVWPKRDLADLHIMVNYEQENEPKA